ncbi:MAG: DUF2269 family protein [Nocardioidaceae bacterium]
METVLTVLHVVAAVFLVGPMAVLPMSAMRAARTGQHAQVQSLAKSTRVFSLASILVIVFGFGVLGMSDPKYDLSVSTSWILISLIAYIVALILNLVVVVPALQSAAQVSDGSGSGAGAAAPMRVAAGSGVVSILLLLAVVLMVWKP